MMSNQRSAFLKSLIAPLFEAMGDFSLSQVKPELEKIFSQDCKAAAVDSPLVDLLSFIILILSEISNGSIL